MTRSSNNVEGAISGVSITLKSEGTSKLSVMNDTAAIQEKITAFVDAYNAVVTLVSDNTAYNSETGTASAFLGEATARDIVNRLQGIIGSRVPGLQEGLRNSPRSGSPPSRTGRSRSTQARFPGSSRRTSTGCRTCSTPRAASRTSSTITSTA
jgi:hypothetical protein